MTQAPSSFDHLDHITNSLIEAGVIDKAVHRVFTFDTPGGAVRWSIDLIREALAKLTPSQLADITRPMPIAEVNRYIANNPVTIGYVDQSYARCMTPAHLDRPLFVIEIPPDIGAIPGTVGNAVVIDGNHRLVYAQRNSLPCTYVVLPPEIELACRIPIE